MIIKIRVNDIEQAIHLEKEQFYHRQLLVEHISDAKSFYNYRQGLECNLSILEHHNQETGHIVHALTVLDFRVVKSVCAKYIKQNL